MQIHKAVSAFALDAPPSSPSVGHASGSGASGSDAEPVDATSTCTQEEKLRRKRRIEAPRRTAQDEAAERDDGLLGSAGIVAAAGGSPAGSQKKSVAFTSRSSHEHEHGGSTSLHSHSHSQSQSRAERGRAGGLLAGHMDVQNEDELEDAQVQDQDQVIAVVQFCNRFVRGDRRGGT